MKSGAYRSAYEARLAEYLASPGEHALRAAYELGREAVGVGLGVLDLADVHEDLLVAALGRVHGHAEVERVARAAADFFLEALSAFEIVQRGYREAQEAVRLEQRQTALLRRLSAFLADASLAVDAAEGADELLQLVAEQTREILGAGCCVVYAQLGGELEAAACGADRDWPTAAQLEEAYAAVRPPRGVLRLDDGTLTAGGWLAAPLTAVDGSELGAIHALDKEHGEFSEVDGEVLLQLAQLASTAVERRQLTARSA